jgi:hypothetical protein
MDSQYMFLSQRRSLFSAIVLSFAVIGLTACGTSSSTRPRPIATTPPPSPEEALAAYRGDLQVKDAEYQETSTVAEAEAFRLHVKDALGARALQEFELFIYINKAGEGPSSQHAFLYESDGTDLRYLDTWLVSTGREGQETSPKGERKFTTTPAGVFQFDVNRFVRLHKSNAWEADMPWAMFLRTRSGGPTTGIALHAALDKYVHNLGQRASAGCIRLLPSNAEKLYKLLQTKYAGSVPNTSSSGINLSIGKSRSRGAKALVIVEDADAEKLVARYGTDRSVTAGY